MLRKGNTFREKKEEIYIFIILNTEKKNNKHTVIVYGLTQLNTEPFFKQIEKAKQMELV